MLKNKKHVLYAVIACAVIVFMVVLAIILDNATKKIANSELDPSDTYYSEVPELRILSSIESGSNVVVDTTYGTFKYPLAFSDLIKFEAVNGESSSQLEFFVHISGKDVPVYSIYYNEGKGDRFGKLSLGGEYTDIWVSIAFADPDDSVKSEWTNTFYAVQETFNTVLSSMEENDGFTSVD